MLLDRFRLDGKVALIVGGGRGLGRVVAEAFGEVGAETIVVGRTASQLHATVGRVERFGHRCLPVVADVTSAEARAEMFQTAIDHFQRIDILVNAAAVGWPDEDPAQAPQGRSFLTSTPADWADVTTVNLDTTAAMIHLVADQMIHLGGGKIVSITSAAGHHASDGFSAYGASKAAIEQLTRTLAHELGPNGIHINCIAPGRIVTMEQEQGDYWTAARRATVGESIAIGRVGEDGDIGPLAVYLASEASDFVTGATFTLDGGGYVLPAAETAP
jgi:7-alpha-hydroxysteroid dehydrogenase